MHTLKESTGVVGFDLVCEYAHQLENMIGLVRSRMIQVDETIINILLESVDWFKKALFGRGKEVSSLQDIMEKLLTRIAETIEIGSVQSVSEKRKEKVEDKKIVKHIMEIARKQLTLKSAILVGSWF